MTEASVNKAFSEAKESVRHRGPAQRVSFRMDGQTRIYFLTDTSGKRVSPEMTSREMLFYLLGVKYGAAAIRGGSTGVRGARG